MNYYLYIKYSITQKYKIFSYAPNILIETNNDTLLIKQRAMHITYCDPSNKR